MKRKRVCASRKQTLEMLDDGLWVLAQVPKVRVLEVTLVVKSPDLLSLGDNPVVTEVKEGRLVARTQLRSRSRVLTFQWEAATATRRKPGPMPLAEFLEYQERVVA